MLLPPSSASAFVLIDGPFRKWVSPDIPSGGVSFVIDNRGEDSVTMADGSVDNGLSEVIAAVQLWNEAAGKTILAPPVRTVVTTFNVTDGVNSIVFNDPLRICTGSCLAATFVGRVNTGTTEVTNGITFAGYIETDITFNATVNWTTHADAGGPGCVSEFDIEGVALHEMGHALGLGHSSNPAATMFAFTSACNPTQIPLDPDDLAGIRCAYVNGAGCAGCENCPVVIPPRTFACGGSDFTTTKVGVSPQGNLVQFESPLGFEHLQVGLVREGSILCYTTGISSAVAFDITDQAGGFLAPEMFQPNGPGTFPLEVFRASSDGVLQFRQRYTGNSFVGPGSGALDLDGNGIVCDSLQECGNCSNRAVHILMEVTNTSALPVDDVALVRVADLDVDGEPAANRFARTSDTVLVWRDSEDATNAHGMLMQGIFGATTPEPLVQTPARSALIDCAPDTSLTPVVGDFVGKLRWSLGRLAPGETKQIRMHYRRW